MTTMSTMIMMRILIGTQKVDVIIQGCSDLDMMVIRNPCVMCVGGSFVLSINFLPSNAGFVDPAFYGLFPKSRFDRSRRRKVLSLQKFVPGLVVILYFV
jgi:hypothetical protein